MIKRFVLQVVATEVTTDGYVATADQVSIAHLVEKELSKSAVEAQSLRAEDWKSVFWQNDFSRPDRYSTYLNSSFDHDQGSKSFSVNVEKEGSAWNRLVEEVRSDREDRSSSSASGSSGSWFGDDSSDSNVNSDLRVSTMNVNDQSRSFESSDKKSQSEIEDFLRKKNIMVHWTGQKFEPKSLKLHRISLADLQRKSTVTTKQIQIRSFAHTEFLDVTEQPLAFHS